MRKALLYILAIFTLMLCTLLSPTGGLAFECIKEGEDLTFANVEDALSNYYSNGYSEELWKLNVHPWIAFQAIEVLRRQDQSKYDIIKENVHVIVYGSVEEDYDHRGTATIWEYAHMEHTDKLDLFDDYSGFPDTSRYNSTRCLNHFSPCVIPKSWITLVAAKTVNYAYTDALEWALDSDINLMSLKHAKDAYSQGELLRIWGHAIHILGDMGCPPHVRNDDHASPPPRTNSSVYEPKLGKISFSELDNYGGGSFDANSIPIKKLGSEREYLDQLADWTRKHFFSQGTMFSPDYPIKDSWASWQWEPVYGLFIPRWGSPLNTKSLYVVASDPSTGQRVKLAAATLIALTSYIQEKEIRSFSDEYLYLYCEALTSSCNSFQIDEAVVQDFWRYSRGEIVSYAAGLINFLFDEYIGLPAPPSPAKLTVVSGDGQVTLSWTLVDGATSYNIYRGTAAGVTTSNGTLIPNVTSPYVDTGLTNGVTYYYAVTAINSSGLESALSGEASAAPVPAAPAPSWSDTVNDPIGDAPSGYDIVKARASHDGFYLSVEIELADSYIHHVYDATFYNTVIGARISTGGAMYMIALWNEPPFCYEADFCFPNWPHDYIIVSYDGGRNWQSLPSVEMSSFATYEGNVITVRAGIARMEAGPWTIDFVSGVLLNSGPFEVEIKDLTDSLIVPEMARPMPSGDCTDNDNTGPTILKSNFINNGQERTSNPTVTLNLAAQDECGVARYQIIPYIGDDAVITKQMAELDTLRAGFYEGTSLDPTKWVTVTERLWAHGFVDIAYQTYIRDVPYTFEFPVIENGKILGACIIWQDAKGNISWAYDDIIFSATSTVSWGEI